MEGKSPLSAATLVRVQALRRAPLMPVFVGLLALLALMRAGELGWASMAAALALGLALDVPGRWIQERLVSLDFLLILGAARGNRVGTGFLLRALRDFAMVAQLGVVLCVVALGVLWGNPVVNMLVLGAAVWSVAFVSGSFLALKIGAGWGTLRMLLMIAAITFACFPLEGIT